MGARERVSAAQIHQEKAEPPLPGSGSQGHGLGLQSRLRNGGGNGEEGLVAQHLRPYLAYSPNPAELFYWRTRSGVEIDFALYGREVFWAIEVKNTAHIHPQDLRPLKSFVADYPECKPILLYRGGERLHMEKIWCIPVEEFLAQLRPSQGLLSWPRN